MQLTQAVAERPLRKGEITSQRILDAAEGLFAERGFAGTTLRDVADIVGLRSPSLYNHFESKEALYAAVLERGLRPVLDALADFVERGDPSERGMELVRIVMDLLSNHPNLPRLLQYETLTGGERLSPLLRGWLAPVLLRAQQLIQRSPAADRWPPEEIPLLVLSLYHAIVGLFTIAPLYKDLSGEDLLRDSSFALQTRFLERFLNALLPDEPQDGPEPDSR